MSLQIVISGLLLGGMYALIASGFSLINGVMKLFSFCHGALVMVGAFVSYWAVSLLGINPFLTIPISMAVMFVLGYLIQRGIINFVVRAPIFMTLILTFGLDMVLMNAALLLWTGNLRTMTVPLSGVSIQFLDARIPVIRLVAFGIAIAVTIGLYVLMSKTRFGRGINAARMDIDAAQLVGVKIPQVYAITFGLGTMLAGAAGSLLAMVGPISPSMGVLFSIKAFAICILGGSGSMWGPLVGGLLMGLLETTGVAIFGAGYQEAVSFFILLVVLIVRPRGIFGKEYF